MPIIALDFETYYDNGYSLSKITTQEYILSPLFEVICVSVQVGCNRYNFTGSKLATGEWLRQFPWSTSMLACHNTNFDGAILAWIFDIHPRYYFCSMMGSRPTLVPFIKGGRMSLAKVSEYLGLPAKGTAVLRAIGMRRSDFTPAQMSEYMAYCDHDTELCMEISSRILKLLPTNEIRLLDLNLRKFIEPAFELDAGIVDAALVAHREQKAQVLQASGLRTRDLLMSNDKFALALKLLRVVPPVKTSPRTGKTTYAFAKTDKEFKALLGHPREAVQTIVAARMSEKSTLMETRLMRFANVAKTRPEFSIPLLWCGAHTLRLSGMDKLNCQNLKRGSALRYALKAPKGYKVVGGDLSQGECRIVATVAGQWDMVSAFADGRDLYCEFGEHLFNRAITTADAVERFLSKQSVLSCQYGVGAGRYYDTVTDNPDVTITKIEATRIVDVYRTTYTEIVALWGRAGQWLAFMADGIPTGTDYVEAHPPIEVHTNYRGNGPALLLPNGMPLYYPQLTKDASGNYHYMSRHGWRKIYGAALVENLIQALTQVIVSRAELNIAASGRHAALQVHDELLYIVKEEDAQAFAAMLHDALVLPVPWLPSLPLAAEVNIGDSYGDCK